MKKSFLVLSAAALAMFAVSCEKESGSKLPNLDNVTEDGFYVYGEATGEAELTVDYLMAAGLNEVNGASRAGMYEKYVVLDADKDFRLVLNEAGKITNYGAELAVFDVSELADNPLPDHCVVKRGELKTGENAPAMRVDETGLYHIVLDLNKEGDLLYPQIVVASVKWGVRGAMNGWGFTPFEAVEVNHKTMTWTLKDVDMPANGEFKFGYGHGWKIQLDDAGNVKANTNLGMESLPNGANIKVEKAGLYDITLTYTLKGGEISKGYTFETKLTKESDIPTTMYIIGNEFGNWDWAAESVVEMTPVNGISGHFWAVRYMTTATEFKFCSKKEWSGDFTQLTNNVGFVTPGNNKVEADGLYMIYVDLISNTIVVEAAKICGIGDAFGSWDVGKYLFTAADGKASIATTVSGNLRMYAEAPQGVTSGDWWTREFNIFDGKIVYRGAGGDQAAVAVSAGQTVTLDFNAGTGSIK